MSDVCLHLVPRDVAKRRGLKWYFTGKTCKYGHFCERQTSNYRCRFCSSAASAAYSKKNKEKVNARVRKNRAEMSKTEEGREVLRRRARRRYLKNREGQNAYARMYAIQNREKISAYKLEYFKRRYSDDVEFRAMERMRCLVKRTIRSSSGSKKKSTIEYLGYSPEDLIEHLESQFEEGMSWANYGEWHIDHIKPVSAFVKEGEGDPGVVNALSNLRPMWAKDNMSKGAKWEGGND